MGKPSRDKGARGERAAVKLLERATRTRWRRARGGDVQALGDVIPVDVPPAPWDGVVIEVKAGYQGMHVGHLLRPTARELGWWAKLTAQARDLGRSPVLLVSLPRWGTTVVTTPHLYEGVEVCAPEWVADTSWDGTEVVVAAADALAPSGLLLDVLDLDDE